MLEQGRQWRAQEPWPWEVATQVCSCMERGGEWIEVGHGARTRREEVRESGRVLRYYKIKWTN